jgi:hypothetical protein
MLDNEEERRVKGRHDVTILLKEIGQVNHESTTTA